MKLRPRAVLTWTPDGAPFARDFNDIYYSKHGGLDETRAVFLDALGLSEAWRGRQLSVIGELGFGAGLNALAVWDLWRRSRQPGAILHFISIEGFPLAAEDAARALAAFPDLHPLTEELLKRWPCRAAGPHRLWFAEDSFCLTILHDDVHDALKTLDGPVDFWLLDGFAPSRNSDMWSEDVMKAIGRASASGAKAATYSVAAQVRRNLETADFEVQRAPGFAHKKERLVATFKGHGAQTSLAIRPQTALIIGGGIAGACTAAALKRRGLEITILEQEGLAAAASGNPAGIVSPRLDIGDDPAGQFLRAAYLHAVDFYRSQTPKAFHPCGVVRGEADSAKAAKLATDPNLPEDWMEPVGPSADELATPAAFFLPQAGLLDPALAVRTLTEGCAIKTGAAVARLEPIGQGWRASDARGECLAEADILIIAAGAGVQKLIGGDWLPLDGRRGALSIARRTADAGRAVSAGAYMFCWGDDLIFGATFDPAPLSQPIAPLDRADHLRNLETLKAAAPQRLRLIEPMEHWRGRASMRVTTPDQLPVAGAMPDLAALQPNLEKLRNGAISEKAIDPPRIPNLFVIGALGARGLTTAPLLGEAVASTALKEPSPLPPALRRAIDPVRFALRKARQNKP